jgi:hypothetical protein
MWSVLRALLEETAFIFCEAQVKSAYFWGYNIQIHQEPPYSGLTLKYRVRKYPSNPSDSSELHTHKYRVYRQTACQKPRPPVRVCSIRVYLLEYRNRFVTAALIQILSHVDLYNVYEKENFL